jgi:hypothetical protein
MRLFATGLCLGCFTLVAAESGGLLGAGVGRREVKTYSVRIFGNAATMAVARVGLEGGGDGAWVLATKKRLALLTGLKRLKRSPFLRADQAPRPATFRAMRLFRREVVFLCSTLTLAALSIAEANTL